MENKEKATEVEILPPQARRTSVDIAEDISKAFVSNFQSYLLDIFTISLICALLSFISAAELRLNA